MVKRSREDAARTREKLLDAAETVFFERGIAAASLEEIAGVAGLTRGAVYWHFDDKDDLVRAIYERAKLPVHALLDRAVAEPEPLAALKHVCIHVLRELKSDQRMQRVSTIMQFRCEQASAKSCGIDQAEKRAQAVEKFTRAFKRAAKAGQLAPGVTPHGAAVALHAYMCGLFSDYLRYDKPFAIDKLAPELVEHFFRGISKLPAKSVRRPMRPRKRA